MKRKTFSSGVVDDEEEAFGFSAIRLGLDFAGQRGCHACSTDVVALLIWKT
jgi:hypothetical protein